MFCILKKENKVVHSDKTFIIPVELKVLYFRSLIQFKKKYRPNLKYNAFTNFAQLFKQAVTFCYILLWNNLLESQKNIIQI